MNWKIQVDLFPKRTSLSLFIRFIKQYVYKFSAYLKFYHSSFQKPKHHLQTLPKGAWKRLKDLRDRQKRRRYLPIENNFQDSHINIESGTLLVPIGYNEEIPSKKATGTIPKRPKDAFPNPSSPVSRFRQSQFQRDLRIHPFTDTNVERGTNPKDIEVVEDISKMPSDKESPEWVI